MQIHVAGLSDRGRVRAQNDDHYCLGPFVEQDTLTALSFDMASCQMRTYGLLTAVADGMGGYAGGGIASRLTLEILSAFYYGEARTGASAADLQAQLARYLAQTAQMLSAHLTRTPEIADAGTT
jgi:serine/threonine protein phosphatase PrpC